MWGRVVLNVGGLGCVRGTLHAAGVSGLYGLWCSAVLGLWLVVS